MTMREATDKRVSRRPESSRARWPAGLPPDPRWKPMNRTNATVRPDGNSEPYRVVMCCGTASDR